MHGRILGAALALLLLPASAQAGTVTSAADTGPNTLRQEIVDANLDDDRDVIGFAPGLDPIELLTALPAITKPVTLSGPATIDQPAGATLTISAGTADLPTQILGDMTFVGAAPSVTVDTGADARVQETTLTGIVFADGSAGALGGLAGAGATVIATGDGVFLGDDADVIVSHNTIVSEAGDAVRLRSHQAQVFVNTLQGGTGHAGLAMAACDDAQVVTQNTIGGEGEGVAIDAAGCQLGGTGEDDGNTITGAAGHGVAVRSTGAQVLGNVISDNGGAGVRIAPGATARLRQNTIADNGGLGIDAGAPGPGGPRAVLTSAVREEGGLRLRGTAPAAGGFNLEVFASPACDATGFGEGARNLGLVAFAVLAPGGAFDVLVPADTDVGAVATATLTGADQATTEFSGCAAITDDPGPGGPGPGGPGPGTTYVPQSAITSPARPRKARRVKAIKGTAVDAERVQVAVTRKGERCKALTKGGKLKRRACDRPRWLAASGTATWKLRLKRRLPPGRYVIRSRAIAPDGSVETTPARATVRLRT
jgi:hypothetical protein